MTPERRQAIVWIVVAVIVVALIFTCTGTRGVGAIGNRSGVGMNATVVILVLGVLVGLSAWAIMKLRGPVR